MKRPVVWIVAAVLAYLVMLIASLPAQQVLSRVDLPPSMSIGYVSGTIWQGQASYVEFDGVGVESLEWQLSALPLLWGQASLDLTAGNSRAAEQVSVNGPVEIGLFSQSFQANDLTVFLPADLMLAYIPMPLPMQGDGRIKIDISSFSFHQTCEHLDGQGQWLNARVTSLRPALDLGNFNADLSCHNGQFVIAIKEPNILGLSAQVEVASDLQYSVTGRFKPSDELPPRVRETARLLGQPDNQGYIELNL